MKKFEIYTDGSCRQLYFGSWAAIILEKGKRKELREVKRLSGSESGTTISRMELMGILSALNDLPEKCQVTVYSDSRYAILCLNYCLNWEANGWRGGEDKKRVIAHQDILVQFVRHRKLKKITAKWVKAHSGNHYNEECDKMAQALTRKMVEDHKNNPVVVIA